MKQIRSKGLDLLILGLVFVAVGLSVLADVAQWAMVLVVVITALALILTLIRKAI